MKKTFLLILASFSFLAKSQVGVGTENPTQQLHVEGNTRLNGNIYDGANNPGATGQVLSSNGTKVQWVNNSAIIPSVSAVFSHVAADMRWDAVLYTGATLTLPPGKWSVNVTLLLDNTVASVTNAVGWFRTTFTNSTTISDPTPDIMGSSLASGSIIGPSIYGLVTGTIIINNTTGANKTYYLWKQFTSFSGPVDGAWNLKNFAKGIAGEDQITATPMN